MLALKIAIRYLLAKKSHNAINAITLVASCGIAIITAATICMLSVFNGFEYLVERLCSNFDAELRIEAKTGKTFAHKDSLHNTILAIDGVEAMSCVLEEDVVLCYGNRQMPARMMGVDSYFNLVSGIDQIIATGEYKLTDEFYDYCCLGAGVATQLGSGSTFIRPITFYAPLRNTHIDISNIESAFAEGNAYCSSIFMVSQAEYDDNLCITSIDFARSMLGDSTAVSAYEIKLCPGIKSENIKPTIAKVLGDVFSVKTRHEQQADSYRIMQIEKWITFLIVIFILLIASFNIIGALSMLIIDKNKEIETLINLGASQSLISQIFACEGLLISSTGAIVGILLGVMLCFLQEHFGLITLGGNTATYIIDAYPVVLHATDVLWTASCVFIIGIIASAIPLTSLKKWK